MKLFRHITVISISEQEKADFLEAGVAFKKVTKGPRGECAIFEIGEDDSRWERVAALIASLEERDGYRRKQGTESFRGTHHEECIRQAADRVPTGRSCSPAPNGWSIRVKALTSYLARGKYRVDSLVVVFQAIGQKAQRGGVEPNDEERVVLAVEHWNAK
jgi:hypothetical protein